jgi:regulator of nonsense transcripts 1
MIQFSKPRRSLVKSMDQFRRHETAAKDFLSGGRSGTPSRFDASFYRTHDALSFIPSDVQSLRSQATYSSGLPMFATGGSFGPGASRGANGAKRSTYGSYASSIISQDAGPSSIPDNASIVGSAVGPSERNMGMTYSQSDRLRRRTSFSSIAGASDAGSLSQYDYKSQDEATDMDDMKSQYAGTQSGVTVF